MCVRRPGLSAGKGHSRGSGSVLPHVWAGESSPSTAPSAPNTPRQQLAGRELSQSIAGTWGFFVNKQKPLHLHSVPAGSFPSSPLREDSLPTHEWPRGMVRETNVSTADWLEDLLTKRGREHFLGISEGSRGREGGLRFLWIAHKRRGRRVGERK